MNQDFSDDTAFSGTIRPHPADIRDAAVRLNLEPYHQRIYELEGRLHHVEEAYIAADRLRTEYQLQLEALTHAAERVATRCRYGDSQKTFQELVELLHEQRKTNQP